VGDHEQDIAQYGTRTIGFRDGRIVSDTPTRQRRNARDELAALPPPEEDGASRPASVPAS
jgi:putative ABC transport system ATP-binding protein